MKTKKRVFLLIGMALSLLCGSGCVTGGGYYGYSGYDYWGPPAVYYYPNYHMYSPHGHGHHMHSPHGHHGHR